MCKKKKKKIGVYNSLTEHLGKRVLDYFCGTSFLLLFLLLFLLFGTSVVTKTSVTEMRQKREGENRSFVVQQQMENKSCPNVLCTT